MLQQSPTLIVWDTLKSKQQKYIVEIFFCYWTPVHGTWLYILCVIINDFHNLWHEQFNNSLLLILSEIHIIKDNKMKKFIHVTKNSDVYLVGNSQICGFEGEYSGQKMNISYSRGAGILDCLAECARQFKAMRGKVRK